MTDRKSLIAEYKDLKNKIRESEQLLESLKERRDAIKDILTSPLVLTFEEYLKNLLTRLIDFTGKEKVGLWFNMDTVYEDVVIRSYYDFVNDYYGDCELMEYIHSLYLDKSSEKVMASVHTRYVGTYLDDDVEHVPFSEIAQAELESGELLITTMMRLIEKEDVDYSLWDALELDNYMGGVQPNPYLLALSSLGPREFSLGALSMDGRYDEIGNLAFETGRTRIADEEFEGCDEVEVIHIPEGVTHIGKGSFRGCSRVQYVDFPESLLEIGERAFEGCERLEKVIFPKRLKSIGTYAFSGCSRLKCINLPDNIDSVGQNAFEGVKPFYISYGRIRIEAAEIGISENVTLIDRTSDMASITLPIWQGEEDVRFFAPPEGVVNLELSDFNPIVGGGPIIPCELWIPCSIKEISHRFGAFTGFLSRISVSPDNQTFDSRDNCNAIIDKEHKSLVCGCISTVIPSGVERIGEDAFNGCWASKIVVPNGVVKIDDAAFSNCFNLKEIILPDSLKSIGDYAFSCCESLPSIFIPDSVTEVGDSLCECCNKLDNVSVPSGLDVTDTFLDYAEEFTVRDPK